MAGDIRIGVGGWTFEPWRGVFYPKTVKQKNELAYASRHLTTIEINGTYYSTFKPDSWKKWRDETPDGFVFTVKVFDIVISLTQGGPANSTQLVATWAYNLSFQQFDYGAGAALNTVLLIIALLVAPVYIRLNRDSLRQA